jgi:hypothetical protein
MHWAPGRAHDRSCHLNIRLTRGPPPGLGLSPPTQTELEFSRLHVLSHPPSNRCLFTQLVFALAFTLAISVLLLKTQPYVERTDDSVSVMAQWVLFFQVFTGLLARVQAMADSLEDSSNSLNTQALTCVVHYVLQDVASVPVVCFAPLGK